MDSTLIQMTLLIACGVGWQALAPAGLTAGQTRRVLSAFVYYLLLPAMVLEVLWTADIGLKSLHYTLLGVSCILSGMLGMFVIGNCFKIDGPKLGALILATSPNVTYLGLPLLEQLFGDRARSVVIQVDSFAATPIMLTIGIMIARHYGQADDHDPRPSALALLNAPPFWSAAVAVALNLNGIAAPEWLMGTLHKLSVAVTPLMLVAMGLSLNWKAISPKALPYLMPIIALKMLLMPILAITLAQHLAMDATDKMVAILDLAMPSMLLGVVYCDRYRLDSGLYAVAVTVTTTLSFICVPFWHGYVMKEFLP